MIKFTIKYLPEILLTIPFLISLSPFIGIIRSSDYYIFEGIVFSFASYMSTLLKATRRRNIPVYYAILLCLIIIFFIFSLFIINNKNFTKIDLFLCTYFGCFLGTYFSMIVEEIDRKFKKED